jgi:hypothetical protein
VQDVAMSNMMLAAASKALTNASDKLKCALSYVKFSPSPAVAGLAVVGADVQGCAVVGAAVVGFAVVGFAVVGEGVFTADTRDASEHIQKNRGVSSPVRTM